MQSVQSDHDHLETSYLPPEGEDVAHLGNQLIPTTAWTRSPNSHIFRSRSEFAVLIFPSSVTEP